MSTQNNDAKTMTGEQVLAAFIKAMRYSDEMDALHTVEGSPRSWSRLDTFVDALGREVAPIAPELHNQLLAYRLRVAHGENSLRAAHQIAEGGAK